MLPSKVVRSVNTKKDSGPAIHIMGDQQLFSLQYNCIIIQTGVENKESHQNSNILMHHQILVTDIQITV